MRLEGYGYEFNAKYIGGPADGLETSVIAINNDKPPEISCLELKNLVETKSLLGEHFFKKSPSDDARVGVYMMDAEQELYNQDVITYHFIEMMNYSDYLTKYRNV